MFVHNPPGNLVAVGPLEHSRVVELGSAQAIEALNKCGGMGAQ